MSFRRRRARRVHRRTGHIAGSTGCSVGFCHRCQTSWITITGVRIPPDKGQQIDRSREEASGSQQAAVTTTTVPLCHAGHRHATCLPPACGCADRDGPQPRIFRYCRSGRVSDGHGEDASRAPPTCPPRAVPRSWLRRPGSARRPTLPCRLRTWTRCPPSARQC